MKTIYCIIGMCLFLCFVINCGGDTNDVNGGDGISDADPLNGILAEVISTDNDYLIVIVTAGDDNFSQDDQIDIYLNEDSATDIKAIQVGDIIDVMYSDSDFSNTDDDYFINAYEIGIVQDL